jgi:hypothetical protein
MIFLDKKDLNLIVSNLLLIKFEANTTKHSE